MSYLFVVYLYDKRRCSAKAIVDPWADAEPGFAGESLVRVAVSPRVEAVFYFPGNFRLKSLAFSFGCEVFLVDDWAEAPAEALRKAGERDWQYVAWMSSDMSDYDVAMRLTPDGFEGRAMIDGEGERVAIDKGVLRTYEKKTIAASPEELGFGSEDHTTFDEAAFERALVEREEPFRPGLLVHDTLGVTRGKVIDALHNVAEGQGEVLWPKGGPVDTPALRRAVVEADDALVPALPLWAHLRDETKKAAGGATKKTGRKKSG
ncbi:hypothetical protein [Polyangium mundeleinium]|uniref:Uncharacterized protein n=1 Tax=Polyangium mundeleinium TaxID=2995306 RepID=A0ABT5EZZ1_9BACT|nr:hypothetical protein [Polyangium mundeleinium]MDC0746365.1 hypothetical protein [Polyangium mundeleinium]